MQFCDQTEDALSARLSAFTRYDALSSCARRPRVPRQSASSSSRCMRESVSTESEANRASAADAIAIRVSFPTPSVREFRLSYGSVSPRPADC